jgi:general secretion pathway protein A
MNNTDIRSLYGLKYNPFLPDLPPEALYAIPGTESFSLRMRSMAENGGFALITGEPGLGKT